MTEIQTEQPQNLSDMFSFVERKQINPFLFVGLSLIFIFFMYQVIGGLITYLLVGALPTAETATAHRLLTASGQILFILVPTVILTRLFTKKSSLFFPWRLPRAAETFFAIMGLFALQQVFQIYLVYHDRIPLPYELKEIIQSAKRILEEVFEVLVKSRSIGELTFVLVIVAFIPAVVEEALFRGFVQGSLSKYIDPVKAALVSGTIFAFSHLDIINLIPLIALGCYFSVLRMRSNSIIIAMTVHFVNNALAVIAVYFGLNDETFLTGMSGVSANDSLLLSQLVLYVLFFAFCFVA